MWVANVPKTFTAQIIWGQKGFCYYTSSHRQHTRIYYTIPYSLFCILNRPGDSKKSKIAWFGHLVENLVSEFYQIADLFIFTKEIQ